MAAGLEEQKWVEQMLQQGLLDRQFEQLLQLQADDGPEFLQEIVALYFQDAASKMDKLDQCWVRQPVNFHEVDQIAHQLKGASASFGACQVAAICVQIREVCQQGNVSTGPLLTQQAKAAVATLQHHFATFMQLLLQQ